MSYCQECGSYLEEDTSVCGSCGSKLNLIWETRGSTIGNQSTPKENAADDLQTTPIEFRNGMEQQEVAVDGYGKDQPQEPKGVDQIDGSGADELFEESKAELVHRESFNYGSHRSQAESHLGKGLIKPVEIENCMDGFHFRYDQPQRQINKVETQNEKLVEFRVSGEAQSSNISAPIGESESQSEAENLLIESNESIENTNQVKDFKTETVTVQVEPEVKFEPESYPGDSGGEAINSVEETQVGADITLEERSESEEPEIEPELPSDNRPEILWEGRRSWNGLPLRETYQITDRSIVILNGSGVKFKEFEWSLPVVVGVKQNWLAKLLNIGNLEISGSDFDPTFVLEGIENPEQLRKTLVEILEAKV